jgi:hypothetical protein
MQGYAYQLYRNPYQKSAWPDGRPLRMACIMNWHFAITGFDADKSVQMLARKAGQPVRAGCHRKLAVCSLAIKDWLREVMKLCRAALGEGPRCRQYCQG